MRVDGCLDAGGVVGGWWMLSSVEEEKKGDLVFGDFLSPALCDVRDGS